MAKTERAPEIIERNLEGPEGFEDKTSELAGFWDGELGNGIQGIPLDVSLSDSEIDTTKTSALIRIRLTKPTVCLVDNQPAEVEAGKCVGVWYKPGMRDILDCAGVETFFFQRGSREIGKPSPMKTYCFKTKGGKSGSRLVPVNDWRKDSRSNTTAFDPEPQVQ